MIIAAFSLAAATILTVAACGSSVSGSAQVNPAAETASTPTNNDLSLPSELTGETALPSDLSELTSLLNNLPTDIPTDLGGLGSVLNDLPTGALPSDLSDLTNLNIPGLNSACLSVASAYASISLALLPALLGGTDSFNADDLQKTVDSLSGTVPDELAPDIKTLGQIAAAASGKSLTEASKLFDDPEFKGAQEHIDAWLSANCGG